MTRTTTVAKGEWTDKQRNILKKNIAVELTDDELDLFEYVCKKTGLDPFCRQIYPVKRANKRLERKVMTIQTGIDGYRVIADRSGEYAGQDDAIIEYDGKWPKKATVTVHRIIAGVRCPFTATAHWPEYAQIKRDGTPEFMWAKMPNVMISKCAEALALRKAFPADLSGIYTHEEMGQADNPVSTTDSKIPPKQEITEDGETKTLPQAVGGLNKTPLIGLVRDLEGALYGGAMERIEVVRRARSLPEDLSEAKVKELLSYCNELQIGLDDRIKLGESSVYKPQKVKESARNKYLGQTKLEQAVIEDKIAYLLHMREKLESETEKKKEKEQDVSQ